MRAIRSCLSAALLVAVLLIPLSYHTQAANGPTSACAGVDEYVAAYQAAQDQFQQDNADHLDVWSKDVNTLTQEDLLFLADDALYIAQHVAAINPPEILRDAATVDTALWYATASLFSVASQIGIASAVSAFEASMSALVDLSNAISSVVISTCPAVSAIYATTNSDPQA